MNHRKTIEIALMLSFLLMFCGCAALYAMPSKTVENTFDTGVVDVTLSTYQLNENGEEEPWVDRNYITPNSTISNIKRITNESSQPCFVRAKVTFFETEQVTRDNLLGISEDWILKEDGYYYHKGAVESQTSVDLFTGVHIPGYVPDEQEGKTFFLCVEVDAIQEQNVVPDYESEQPWGEVAVLKAEADGGNIITTVESYAAFSISYLGGADGFIAEPEDFFSNLPVLYPGDAYSDVLELNNESSDQIRLYFRSSVPEDEDDTLERMQMMISVERTNGIIEELYSGPIRTDQFAKDTEIITLLPGESGSLHFTVIMPADMDNDYALKHKSVFWTFSTEVIPEDVPNAPETGDSFTGVPYLIGMAVSAGLFLVILFGKRRRDEGSEISTQ